MTHDELLAKIAFDSAHILREALRAVVELHKPDGQSEPFPDWANCCGEAYPCKTIEAIEKELE